MGISLGGLSASGSGTGTPEGASSGSGSESYGYGTGGMSASGTGSGSGSGTEAGSNTPPVNNTPTGGGSTESGASANGATANGGQAHAGQTTASGGGTSGTVTVNKQGAVTSPLSFWQSLKINIRIFSNPAGSQREWAEAAGYQTVRDNSSTSTSPTTSTPPASPPTVLGTAALIVGGFIPGVGEAMDMRTLVAADSTLLDRGLAAASLTVSVATAGVAPNFGGAAKGVRSLGRAASKSAPKAGLLDMIGSANLPYRTSVTVGVMASRFFATRTGYQQVIKRSVITKWLQGIGWESHHWAISRSRGRAGSEGLRRITEAGWNLIPIPSRWNRAISNGGLGFNATRILVGASPGIALYGGYKLGTVVIDVGCWITGGESGNE